MLKYLLSVSMVCTCLVASELSESGSDISSAGSSAGDSLLNSQGNPFSEIYSEEKRALGKVGDKITRLQNLQDHAEALINTDISYKTVRDIFSKTLRDLVDRMLTIAVSATAEFHSPETRMNLCAEFYPIRSAFTAVLSQLKRHKVIDLDLTTEQFISKMAKGETLYNQLVYFPPNDTEVGSIVYDYQSLLIETSLNASHSVGQLRLLSDEIDSMAKVYTKLELLTRSKLHLNNIATEETKGKVKLQLDKIRSVCDYFDASLKDES